MTRHKPHSPAHSEIGCGAIGDAGRSRTSTNWFTEGFDTADLKDAKSLLDELSD